MSKTLEKIDAAFRKLVAQKTFLPTHFVERINDGLDGKKTNTLEEYQHIIENPPYLFLKNPAKLIEMGYTLSDNDVQLIIDTDAFVEEVFSITIREHYGWGIPTEEPLQKLSQWLNESSYDGLVEVGAGSGLWAAMLQKRSHKNIIATDLQMRSDTPKAQFFPVSNRDGIEIQKTTQYPIFMVWPDTNTTPLICAENLAAGSHLIIDGSIAFTGTNQFYHYLDEFFDVESTFESASFSGNETTLHILKKRETPQQNNTYFSSKRITFGKHKIS